MVDPSSAIWGYGFGRIDAKREAEVKAKTRRRKRYWKVEHALIALENFEIKNSTAIIAVKNVDVKPATVMRVNLWKVLRWPVIKSGLLREKIKFFERVDKEVRPGVFTLLPSQVLNIEMSLNRHQKRNKIMCSIFTWGAMKNQICNIQNLHGSVS